MLMFDFMQRALLAGTFLSVTISLIGVFMINRKTSMLGEAMSHVSLFGVALGLILGYNPVVGAILVCIVAGLSIERVRKHFPEQGDMATAIITSIGLGLAAVCSDFLPGGSSLESYMFGSVTSVSVFDVGLAILMFVLVVLLYGIVYYGALLNLSIDEQTAKLVGVKVGFLGNFYTILTAITIAIAAKMIGALIVTSLIILPVVSALLVAKSYFQMTIFSAFFGLFYMLTGIVLSYYIEVSPGGMLVLVALLTMLVIVTIQKLFKNKKASV